MTSYLAKHHTLEQYSHYTFTLSICTPIFLFFNMNSRVLIASNKDKYSYFHWRNYRILTLGLALLICAILGYSLLGPASFGLILVLAGFRLVDGVFEWTYGFYVSDEKGDRVGRSQIFRSLALLIPIGIGLTQVFEMTIEKFYCLILVGLIGAFLWSDRKHLVRDYMPRARQHSGSTKTMRSILTLALPLGLMALLDSLSLQIPKYVFKYFDLETMVGIFTSLFVFVQTMTYLSFSVVNSTMASTKEYYNQGNPLAIKNIVTKSNLVMFLSSILFIGGVYVIGEWVLNLFYTPEIASYHQEFFYLSMVAIQMQVGLVYGFTLFSFNAYKQLLVISLVTAISILVLSIILIPRFSILGGIFAFSIGQMIKCLLFIFQYRFMIRRL